MNPPNYCLHAQCNSIINRRGFLLPQCERHDTLWLETFQLYCRNACENEIRRKEQVSHESEHFFSAIEREIYNYGTHCRKRKMWFFHTFLDFNTLESFGRILI